MVASVPPYRVRSDVPQPHSTPSGRSSWPLCTVESPMSTIRVGLNHANPVNRPVVKKSILSKSNLSIIVVFSLVFFILAYTQSNGSNQFSRSIHLLTNATAPRFPPLLTLPNHLSTQTS